MRYGCSWYPEQWPEATWDQDLRLMADAGMNVVRIGEFAWSSLEPGPDRFTADWMERAITQAAAQGIGTVIGTPTAGPPAWLTTRHPEILRVEPDGRRQVHGRRCHFNPAHPVYLEHCRRIAGALATRFGGHPGVLGWQIDNEFSDLSHDDLTAAAFRGFLRRRFGDLAALNRAWTTAYWSMAYQDWEQILPPDGRGNLPGLTVAWRDFATEVWTAYAQVQAAAIRPHLGPGRFITTNATFEFARQDPSVLFRDLDFCAADVYLGSGSPQVHLDPGWMGVYLAAARGVQRKPFWVMETQPGSIDWFPVNPPMDPGEVRRMVYHQVGHGAEAVMFWQWRATPNCIEQYHGCLIGQGGRPRPVFAEIAATGRELRRLAPILSGTQVSAQVAVAWTYRDRGLINDKRMHQDFDPWRHLRDHYAALRRHGLDVDVVDPRQGLAGYRLCLAPNLAMLDKDLEDLLLAYVEAGGVLVLGPRSGTRDTDGALLPSDPPGARLATALGGQVREYYCLTAPVPIIGAVVGQAGIWGEWLEADHPETEVVLRYGPGHPWLSGQAAMLWRPSGRGAIAYLGTWPDPTTLAALAGWCCDRAGVPRPWSSIPAGVEVSCRESSEQVGRMGGKIRVFILINHNPQACTLTLPWPLVEAGTDRAIGDQLVLAPGEVAVLRTPPG